MIRSFVFCLLLMFAFETQAQVLGYYTSKTPKIESENLAGSEENVEGIDFKEWESDFDKSVSKTTTDCKGQNCQFKNKQALDPSFDF